MLFADAYVIYADGGKDTVVVVLYDIGMCQELEWHCSHVLCMCLIYYTLGCLMLHALGVTYIMKYLFLFWTSHHKTYII